MSTTAERTTRHVALRIHPDRLRTIDAEAQQRGLSRSEYMVQASTGTLRETTHAIAQRVTDLETAVERLQQALYAAE